MRGRIAAVMLLLVFMTTALCAQGSSDPTVDAQRHTTTPPAPSSAEIEMQKRAAKQRNEERFAQLKKDSDHLLELATELKKSVDAANDQTLSLEIVRKAEQIEKLAKQVRQKMMAQ